jgi:uncharacterized membrane protein YfcA
MVFTSLSSMRAHHAHGAVDWKIARAMAPGMLAGSFAARARGVIPDRPLAVGFTCWCSTRRRRSCSTSSRREPRSAGRRGLSRRGVIGAVSSLLAAGGAFLTIPFLTWCKVPLRRAIGTAAANGLPIAIAGTAGYILMACASRTAGAERRLRLSAGARAGRSTSMLAAPLGARLAHSLPVKRLRTIFALLLYFFRGADARRRLVVRDPVLGERADRPRRASPCARDGGGKPPRLAAFEVAE